MRSPGDLTHAERAGNFDASHPSIHSAFTAAKTFRENSQAFVNLSIYEQRITRPRRQALNQLKELQAERKAHETQALPFDPTTFGFVYSLPEIDREIHRRHRLAMARETGKHNSSPKAGHSEYEKRAV